MTIDIIATAREAGFVLEGDLSGAGRLPMLLERFAALVRAQVIEQAARLLDRRDTGDCSREDMEARACAAAIRGMKSDSGHSAAADACASTAPLPERPFAIVIGRGFDGDDSLELAVHDGVNYCMSDGDCFDRDGDTLDGYTAEFLTQYELEKRLDAAHRRSVAGDQKQDEQAESASPSVLLIRGEK